MLRTNRSVEIGKGLKAIIQKAIPEMDKIIAGHFYQLWLNNNVTEDLIDDD